MSAKPEIVELSPLKTATLVWRPQQGPPVMTVVCKATYDLTPGVAPLSEAQDDVNRRDLHRENNPKLGLHSASDLVPYKPRADVTLVGKAFAPPRELAQSVVARLQVGSVDKRVEVHAERFLTRDRQVQADKFFSKMPIGYERAAGGPLTANPVGLSLDSKPDSMGRIALPNLQMPGETVTGQPLTPIGFGPIPASWPMRRALGGEDALELSGDDWLSREVSSEYDWDYFNVAPRDQQLVEIRPDERIHLEYLHPEEVHLDTHLPGYRPCVYVEGAGGAQRVAMKGDTLWIDTNRLVQTLTWRGHFAVADPDARVRVLVSMVDANTEVSWDEVWRAAEHRRRRAQVTVAQGPSSTERADALGRLTSPVQLVPNSDHLPVWMPPPSSGGTVRSSHSPVTAGQDDPGPSSSLVVGLTLRSDEGAMLAELCESMNQDAEGVLKEALRQAYRSRFGGDESG